MSAKVPEPVPEPVQEPDPNISFTVYDPTSGNILYKPFFTTKDAIHRGLCHILRILFKLLITGTQEEQVNTYKQNALIEFGNIMRTYQFLIVNTYSLYYIQYETAKALAHNMYAITKSPDTILYEMQKRIDRITEIKKNINDIITEIQTMIAESTAQFTMLFDTLIIKMRDIGIANQIIYAPQIQEEGKNVKRYTAVPNNNAIKKAKEKCQSRTKKYYDDILRNLKVYEELEKRSTICKFASESEFKYAVDSIRELANTCKPLCYYICDLFKLLKDAPVV